MIGKGLETHVTRDQMSGDLPCPAQPPLWPKLQECQNTPIRKYTNTQIDKYTNTQMQKYANIN